MYFLHVINNICFNNKIYGVEFFFHLTETNDAIFIYHNWNHVDPLFISPLRDEIYFYLICVQKD